MRTVIIKFWAIRSLSVVDQSSSSFIGAFKFYGYLRVSNIEHYKYIREEDRIEKEHEILVQEVKKPNLPTSQYVSFSTQ